MLYNTTKKMIRLVRASGILGRQYSIRSAGGSFAHRESAEEERFAHERELEEIRKLKQTLLAREKKIAAKLGKPVEADAQPVSTPRSPEQLGYSPGAPSGGGAFGKKEAAIEEKYFHDQNRIKTQQLKEEIDHRKK